MKLWFWDRKAAIDRWYAEKPFLEEPTIRPLKLPPIKALRGERDSAKKFKLLKRA